MPRTLTAAIESESIKSRLRVVDLLEVTFPAPIGKKYWAKTAYVYKDQQYAPRVLSIGAWKRTMSPETDDLTVVLGNVDGEITKIFNTVEMEMAELSLIRYYPDIEDAIDPLWVGWGGTIKIDEEQATWNVHFGFRGFKQRGLRKLVYTCWKKFADGVYCPYDGVDIGKCGRLSNPITVEATELITDQPLLYAPNDLIRIDDEVMLILDRDEYTLIVDRAQKGTVATTHSADTRIYHHNCPKTEEGCVRRRMYGPPTHPDGLRYFGGWRKPPEPEAILDGLRQPLPRMLERLFALMFTNLAGNASVLGRVIPAIYGECKLIGVPAVYAKDLGEFRHAFFILGEGVGSAVEVGSIRMSGLPIDNVAPWTPDWWWKDDSCVVWWGETGQRECYAASYDYTGGTYIDNPWLVNDSDGSGPSLSDLFCIRIRTEESGEERNDFKKDMPTLDIRLIGRRVRTIQGWIDDNPYDIRELPDPIEVAVDYLVNGKFGARLDISRIDLESARACSAYCREIIKSTDERELGVPVQRFLFNGALMQDKSVEAQLASILDNCNGYYIPEGRKIAFGIRKAEDLEALESLPDLTDYGPDRNILREDGKSTLVVENVATTDGYVNNIELSFADASQDWQSNTLYIFDEEQQLLAAKVGELGEDLTRNVNTKQISLVGTTTLDQAQRLGVLKLREEYMKKRKYTFKMSLKDSIQLSPGDVRRLDSYAVEGRPEKKLSNALYVRIWKIEETDKFTASVEACLHINEYYDNEVGVVI